MRVANGVKPLDAEPLLALSTNLASPARWDLNAHTTRDYYRIDP